MKKVKDTIQIIEYERLYLQKREDNDKVVDKKTFESLESFILENDTPFLVLKSYRRRKYIQAQNYVGLIQTKSGITIEILPKITNLDKNTKENQDESRKILIKMIKTLKKPPFKNINKADLKNSKMPLFEVFIKMFLDELSILFKLGIKSNYLQKQDNLKFLKGKLLVNQQIKKNYIHKERFFTEFDEFSINRVENRLIKTALLFLLKKSNSNNNKKLIKRYLMIFDSVSASYNVKNDFNKLKITRDMLHYETIISWSEIFLLNESFSIYKGNNIAFALLFDMNKLFESYVGNFLRKECFKYNSSYKVNLQDREYHLAYMENRPIFQLKPDIVIEISNETLNQVQSETKMIPRTINLIFEEFNKDYLETTFKSPNKDSVDLILDTKWKIPRKSKTPPLGGWGAKISISDMYQLYAYGMKYENCNRLYLIYPLTKKKLEYLEFNFNEKNQKELKLKILFFDLKNDEIS